MVCEQQEGLKNREFAEFRIEFIPGLRCSLVYGSVRELKRLEDRQGVQEEDWVEQGDWIKLVKFAEIHGLGVLQRLENFEMTAFRDFQPIS